MTRITALLASVAAGLLVGVSTVHAVTPTLTPSTTAARAGETVTFTGNFCGTGASITGISITTKTEWPKAPVMTLPVDLATAGVVQSGSGFTFTHTPTDDRVEIWFSVTCSDGSSASSDTEKVTVWPPAGDLWFITPYPGPFYGERGQLLEIDVRSIECSTESPAIVSLIHGTNTVVSTTGQFLDTRLHVELAVPASTSGGTDYETVVTCASIERGETIVDSHPTSIAPFSDLPVIGSGTALAVLAALSTTVGAALVRGTRRQRPA